MLNKIKKLLFKRTREDELSVDVELKNDSYHEKTSDQLESRLNHIYDVLIEVTTKHFKRLEEECGDDKIYGYTLYTSDDASSVGPVANRVSDFSKDKSDKLFSYYRYGAQEWKLWDDFGYYTEVNSLIRTFIEDTSLEIEFIELREHLFSLFLKVLEDLKSEGIFNNMYDDAFLAVWVSDSANKIMSKSAKLLNEEKIYLEFAKEYGAY